MVHTQNSNHKNAMMNSLGLVSMPIMPASSHATYQAHGPLIIDESQVGHPNDNTMQQILNQSQITASADGALPGALLFESAPPGGSTGLNSSTMHTGPTSTS